MEEMAAMLSEYAGGLQQSFSTVFDRVGQSLAQSAQMMQMMNDVMEAALLQNLRVECRFDAATAELLVSIANRSQILLRDVTLAVYFDSTEPVSATLLSLPALPAAATADSTVPAMMTTAAFSQAFASFSPGEQHEVRVPLRRVPVAGTAELMLRSPGTQAPLLKRCPFRVSLFESVTFHVVERERVAMRSHTTAQSTAVDLQKLRGVLRLSPLDAMVTADVGSYAFAVAESGAAAASYYLSISHGTSGASSAEVTIAAAASTTDTPSETIASDVAAAKRACEALVAELEAVSALP